MSRSRCTLATVVVALSSWSCGSTAPDVTPKVGAIVVSPASSTITLNAQLPLQAEVRDDSGGVVPDAAITWTVEDSRIVSISRSGKNRTTTKPMIGRATAKTSSDQPGTGLYVFWIKGLASDSKPFDSSAGRPYTPAAQSVVPILGSPCGELR